MDHRLNRPGGLGTAVLVAILLGYPLPARAAGKRVAVLEFQASWSGDCAAPRISGGEVADNCELLRVLPDQARSGALVVLRPPAFVLMTKENTAQLLQQMGTSQPCNEGECEVETAKLIGADLVISGSISRVEATWLASVKLHDVRSAALLGSRQARGRNKIDLMDAVKAEVALMVLLATGSSRPAGRREDSSAATEGRYSDEGPPYSFAPDTDVIVSFQSDPTGTSVSLDGQRLCDATPCRRMVGTGTHQATFERERYAQATQTFTAEKGSTVKATLAPRFGWLSLVSDPSALTVRINGVAAGVTPLISREVDEGPVDVAIEDSCYFKVGERIVLRAGERRTIRLEAKPRLAALKVIAEDAKGDVLDAQVHVDGHVVGPAGTTLTLPLCSKTVAVNLGRETWNQKLELKEGATTVLTARESTVPAGSDGDESKEPSLNPARQGLGAGEVFACKDAAGNWIFGTVDQERCVGRSKRSFASNPNALSGKGSTTPGASEAVKAAQLAPSAYRDYVRGAAEKYSLSEELLHAVIVVGSGSNPKARSRDGKIGLMQLKPELAKEMYVRDIWSPEQNIYGGARYLRILANRYQGDLVKTLAAYTGGTAAVDRAGGLPARAATQEFVFKVLDIYERLKRQQSKE